MATDVERIVGRLASILITARSLEDDRGWLGEDDARGIVTRAAAAIERFAPPGSVYVTEANAIRAHDTATLSWKADHLCAVVRALRDDYEMGGFESVAELVHADVFDDFLDMAQELLDKTYLGPAAVVAGSVLEEHLRKLADKRDIPLSDNRERPKSVERLTVDLRQAGQFTEVQRKNVQARYGQRTAGAHGHADQLEAREVERMIDSVRDFIARHPA